MKNITINPNSTVVLSFNPKFYQKDAIIESCEAFDEILDSKIDEKEEFEVTLSNINEEIDIKTIGYEFFNYCFGLMKNNSLI